MSAPQNNLLTFVPGTIIQSAQVNQNFNDIVELSGASVGSQLQTLLSTEYSGFIPAVGGSLGGVITTASGLTVNMSAVYIVVAGIIYYMPAQSFTVTASRDTYIDFVPGTVPTYIATPVTNGASSPALAAGNVRIGKVISGASTITSNVQNGEDSLGNVIYPTALQNAALMTPWIPFTPSISSSGGTLTTASATGRYQQIGKTIIWKMDITITTNGTGSGAIFATLPVMPHDASAAIGSGREDAISGKMLQVKIATAPTVSIFNYDGTYPGASGAVLRVNGSYEAQ